MWEQQGILKRRKVLLRIRSKSMRESGNWKGAVYGSLHFIPASKVVVTEKDQKKVVKDSFSVSAITISADKVITGISVINQKKAEVFRWGNLNAAEKNNGDANEEWQELYRELERTKVPEEQILKRYGVKSLSELDEVSRKRALNGLKRTKSAA